MAKIRTKAPQFTNPEHMRVFLERAYGYARKYFPAYSCKFSKKEFTLSQIAACLLLKEFFELDYRLLVKLLETDRKARKVLGLETVPVPATFCRYSARIPKKFLAATKREMCCFLVGAHAGLLKYTPTARRIFFSGSCWTDMSNKFDEIVSK